MLNRTQTTGIRYLTMALQSAPDDLPTAKTALRGLALWAGEGHNDQIYDSTADIVLGIRQHGTDETVAVHGMHALARICTNTDYIPAVAPDLSCIEQTLQAHPQSTAVQQYGLWALGLIAANGERIFFENCGLLLLLVNRAMTQFPRELYIVRYGISVYHSVFISPKAAASLNLADLPLFLANICSAFFEFSEDLFVLQSGLTTMLKMLALGNQPGAANGGAAGGVAGGTLGGGGVAAGGNSFDPALNPGAPSDAGFLGAAHPTPGGATTGHHIPRTSTAAIIRAVLYVLNKHYSAYTAHREKLGMTAGFEAKSSTATSTSPFTNKRTLDIHRYHAYCERLQKKSSLGAQWPEVLRLCLATVASTIGSEIEHDQAQKAEKIKHKHLKKGHHLQHKKDAGAGKAEEDELNWLEDFVLLESGEASSASHLLEKFEVDGLTVASGGGAVGSTTPGGGGGHSPAGSLGNNGGSNLGAPPLPIIVQATNIATIFAHQAATEAFTVYACLGKISKRVCIKMIEDFEQFEIFSVGVGYRPEDEGDLI